MSSKWWPDYLRDNLRFVCGFHCTFCMWVWMILEKINLRQSEIEIKGKCTQTSIKSKEEVKHAGFMKVNTSAMLISKFLQNNLPETANLKLPDTV